MSLAYSSNPALEERILRCQKCEMQERRCFPMEGPVFSTVMIVGQAPHPYRKIKQPHFSGKASKQFTDLLLAIGLKREEVYITNAIKCIDGKSKGSRELCVGFLEEEIAMVHPLEIFLLGADATHGVCHGKRPYGIHFERGRHLYVLPHPAAGFYGNDEERVKKTHLYYDLLKKVIEYRKALVNRKGQTSLDHFGENDEALNQS